MSHSIACNRARDSYLHIRDSHSKISSFSSLLLHESAGADAAKTRHIFGDVDTENRDARQTNPVAAQIISGTRSEISRVDGMRMRREADQMVFCVDIYLSFAAWSN